MKPVEEPGISVEEVEREIAAGTRRLQFSPAIEAEFERTSAARRLQLFLVTGTIAVSLFDAFLIADWVTLHDMFPAMVVARLVIFTPILTILMLIIYRGVPSWVRESTAAAGGILGVLLPMVIMVFSESPYRLNYQYGSLLIMMFSTVVQRLRFRFAVFALACMLSIQLATTSISKAFDAETYLGIVIFFLTASLLMALTTYFLEHGERRSFLFALRGELLRDQIEAIARTDPLTGLFNRRHLTETKTEIWDDARSAPRTVSVILLDIDHFKAFNDSRGHLEGDACLRTVSGCVSEIAKDRRGLAFRFGGEEILVLMPGTDLAEAVEVAESMRRSIEGAAIPHDAIGGVVTASIGVASCVAPEAEASALIARADATLYQAKGMGRNRVVSETSRLPSCVPHLSATAA